MRFIRRSNLVQEQATNVMKYVFDRGPTGTIRPRSDSQETEESSAQRQRVDEASAQNDDVDMPGVEEAGVPQPIVRGEDGGYQSGAQNVPQDEPQDGAQEDESTDESDDEAIRLTFNQSDNAPNWFDGPPTVGPIMGGDIDNFFKEARGEEEDEEEEDVDDDEMVRHVPRGDAGSSSTEPPQCQNVTFTIDELVNWLAADGDDTDNGVEKSRVNLM